MGSVAVVLSGCGYLDGAEVHESVLCLLALSQKGVGYQCFAPDIPQKKVVNHLNKEQGQEVRNVLVESARIARSNIKALSELKADDFDAILLPGGFGAALNLSSFAIDGPACSVLEDLRDVLLAFYAAKKPIAATCITPAVLAKVFEGKEHLTLTLGSNPEFLSKIEEMGHEAKPATADEVVADDKNKVYTTPCYMEPPNLAAMFEGVKKLVDKIV